MLVLVAYDVNTESLSGSRRLRKISKICVDYGQRVQYSVFECDLDPSKWENLKSRLLKVYDPDKDSLRFYYLGSNWKRRVEHHGVQSEIDTDGAVII